MERANIINRLNNIFRDVLDNSNIEISEASSAETVKGWDSLSHIEIVSSIEEDFDITFTSKEIVSWKNVGELIDSIEGHIK